MSSSRSSNFKAAQEFADFGLADRDAGNRESASGPGSSRNVAQRTIELLTSTIETKKIRSILDLGCGDWNWMADVKLPQSLNGVGVNYQGWDASPALINELNRKYRIDDLIEFHLRDITTASLPKVDLIIARDVLFHLPIEISVPLVNRIKASCNFLLSTSFINVQENSNISPYNAIEGWGYYNINLNVQPFALSENLEVAYREKTPGCARYICLYDFTESEDSKSAPRTSIPPIKAPGITRQTGPQVSVIVPCYNSAGFVKQFVETIRNQSCDSWELLLMDDGSTDATVDHLIMEADQDQRIKPFSGDANMGPSVRRNRGMEIANGRFILFADCDDLLKEDGLERLVELAERDGAEVVRGSHILIDRNGEKSLNQLEQFHQSEIFGTRYQDCPSLVQLYSSWNMLISRDLVRRNKLRFEPDIRIGEDRIFNQMVFDSARSISLTKQTTYFWRRDRPEEDHLSMTRDPEARFHSILRFWSVLSGLRGTTDDHLRKARSAMSYEAAHCLELALKQGKPFEFIESIREWIQVQKLNVDDLDDLTIKGRTPALVKVIRRELGMPA